MKIKKISNKFRVIAVNNSKVVNNEYLVDTGFVSYFCSLKHMVFDTFMKNFFNGSCSHFMFTVFPKWETDPAEEEEENTNTESEFKDDEDFCPESVYD